MQSDLTMWQAVLQSQAIHPDWDAQMHLAYLDMECFDTNKLGRGTEETALEVIERWLLENADSGRVAALLKDAGML